MKRWLISQCIKFEYHHDQRHWFMSGQFHRDDGPAIEDTTSDYCSWWKHGKFIKDSRWSIG